MPSRHRFKSWMITPASPSCATRPMRSNRAASMATVPAPRQDDFLNIDIGTDRFEQSSNQRTLVAPLSRYQGVCVSMTRAGRAISMLRSEWAWGPALVCAIFPLIVSITFPVGGDSDEATSGIDTSCEPMNKTADRPGMTRRGMSHPIDHIVMTDSPRPAGACVSMARQGGGTRSSGIVSGMSSRPARKFSSRETRISSPALRCI